MTILIIISYRRVTFDFTSGGNGKFRTYPEGTEITAEWAGCLGLNEQVLELYNNARACNGTPTFAVASVGPCRPLKQKSL